MSRIATRNRGAVEPELLRWALKRAGRTAHDFAEKYPKPPQWERREALPTLKQISAPLAAAAHVV